VSTEARRRRRVVLWTALGVVVALVAGLGALQMNASRLEAEVQEAGARATTARPQQRERPVSASPSSGRAVASVPEMSRALRRPSQAALLVAASGPARPPAPAPARPDFASVVASLEAERLPGSICMSTYRLGATTHDGDYLLPDVVRAWLDEHATEIDAITAALVSVDGDAAAQQVRDPSLLHCVLAADAVRWTEDGEQALADESMAALLRLVTVSGELGRGYWIGEPGLLRRVRPASSAGWVERIDDSSPREDCLGFLRNRALMARPSGPVRLRSQTLDVLHDDLPAPIRSALDAAVFAPLEDARWARRSMILLDLHAELAASVDCLSDRARARPWTHLQGEREWQDVWDLAVLKEADLLVAREVMRLAHPELGLAPRESPCPDWSIVVETLPTGARRIRALPSDPTRAMPFRDQAPLEYEVPP